MTTTLLKHEYLRTRGMLGLLLGGGLAIVVVATLLALTRWPVLSGLGIAAGALVTVIILPATQIALAIDYWRSSYRQFGYFTQSIPARGSTIFWSKMLWGWLGSLAAIVVTLVATAVFWTAFGPFVGVTGNPLTMLGTGLEFISQHVSGGMLTAIITAFVLLMLMWPVQYYFGASIGSEAPLNRLGIGGPIIVLVVFYFLSQFVTTLGILFIPFGLGAESGSLAVVPVELGFAEAFAGQSSNDVMPLGFLPVLALISALCLWRTHYSWNHKVSLV